MKIEQLAEITCRTYSGDGKEEWDKLPHHVKCWWRGVAEAIVREVPWPVSDEDVAMFAKEYEANISNLAGFQTKAAASAALKNFLAHRLPQLTHTETSPVAESKPNPDAAIPHLQKEGQ